MREVTYSLLIAFLFNSFMAEAVIIRNQSIYFFRKSMDWFLYDNGLRHERVKQNQKNETRVKLLVE